MQQVIMPIPTIARLFPLPSFGEGGRAGLRRPYLLLLLALVGLANAAHAQTYRYSPNFLLSAKNFCDTIPIEVEDDLILVPVTMNGQRYRFCLDTGSSQGMVYANTNIYPLLLLGNILSRDANNRTDTVSVVQLPPFTLTTHRPSSTTHRPSPSLTITGYVASLMPRRAVSTKYDAVIGFDLFNRGLCAKIDTQQGYLILTDSKKFFQAEEALGHALNYKLKWFVPYVYVSPFVRHTDEALFDTGSAPLYTMNSQSLKDHLAGDLANLNKHLGADIERQVEGRAQGHLSIGGFGVEKKDEVAFLHLDRLKWANFAFTDLHTITTQGASKVGSQLLNYGSLIINPFKKKLTFLPYPHSLLSEENSAMDSSDCVRVGNKQLGVAFVPQRGQASVGLIWEESEPYKAGMRQGDVVLQIDHRPILTFSDFLRFRFIKGEPHRFRLRNLSGEEKIVECVIKE